MRNIGSGRERDNFRKIEEFKKTITKNLTNVIALCIVKLS